MDQQTVCGGDFVVSSVLGSDKHGLGVQLHILTSRLAPKYLTLSLRTMNLSLLDPFTLAQDYPESLSSELRSGHSTCVALPSSSPAETRI